MSSEQLISVYPKNRDLDYWVEVIERNGQSHLWQLNNIESFMQYDSKIRIWSSNLPVQSQLWSDVGILTLDQLLHLLQNHQIMTDLLEYQKLFQNWNFEDQIEFACKLNPIYKVQMNRFKSSEQLLKETRDSLYPALTTEELINLWKQQNDSDQVTPLTKVLSNFVPEESMYVRKLESWQPVSGMEYYSAPILKIWTDLVRVF